MYATSACKNLTGCFMFLRYITDVFLPFVMAIRASGAADTVRSAVELY
ncbi:hypothetical protein BN8_01098 [Fibrisoma limi BUZ 3]|uniref:Uncharacterized protein n=1 Tax=Fibrisoma limi BUZ 3 TaxID=1185876 RepID=I2GDZ9_9BACT|nr:hypothetical protein BN8_01098 [Fibrisoma limi BUZ 3]